MWAGSLCPSDFLWMTQPFAVESPSDWVVRWAVTRRAPREDPRAGRAMTENHLNLKRWILPVAVLGSSGTNSIQRGYL